MSHKRQVWETFSQLAHRLLAAAERSDLDRRDQSGPDEVAQELKRLGKAQFKANTLQETALDQLRQTLDQLAATEGKPQSDAHHDLLAALLPVLDGIQAALESGERLLARPDDGQDDHWVQRMLESEADQEQATWLMRQSDRVLMSAWLAGLQLVCQRLLALLAEAGVEPIPTIGYPFDPYLHQAVGTTNDGAQPPGTIVAEERRGYTGLGGVLRYAQVIVGQQARNSNVRDLT